MDDRLFRLKREIAESIAVTSELERSCSSQIIEAATTILTALQSGGKIIAFGNGGSAAEAQHLVAELVGRYRTDRQPLAAVALTVETASLTAIANDYGFEQIFSRQLLALAKPGDVAVAISTSGNSANVLMAVEAARSQGLVTIGLTGKTGGKLTAMVQVCLHAPSDCTARIQEMHMLMIHLVCGFVEDAVLTAAEPSIPVQARDGEVC